MTTASGPGPGGESPPEPRLHMGIAEQGKLHALDGDHETALAHYRAAIDMTVHAGDPEIFFRHYLESVLESLEQIGAHDEVLDYCDKAEALLEAAEVEDLSVDLELMHVHQRRGVNALKAGRTETAQAALREAADRSRRLGVRLPLADLLLNWIARGYAIDPARILAEQRRFKYFNVRRETVDPARAVPLPDAQQRRRPTHL